MIDISDKADLSLFWETFQRVIDRDGYWLDLLEWSKDNIPTESAPGFIPLTNGGFTAQQTIVNRDVENISSSSKFREVFGSEEYEEDEDLEEVGSVNLCVTYYGWDNPENPAPHKGGVVRIDLYAQTWTTTSLAPRVPISISIETFHEKVEAIAAAIARHYLAAFKAAP